MTDGVEGPEDARRLLGLDEWADAEDVRAARRRLAKALHPDAGGDPDAMRRVNEAADIVLGCLERGDAGGLESAPAASAASAASNTSNTSNDSNASTAAGRRVSHGRYDSDRASFTIESLPAEAFEALLVVTSWIGEVIVDDPPYELDVLLTDPLHCWCRLDLVPDAGASTVGVAIAALPGEVLPDIDAVRDLWVRSLNDLGRAD